MFHNLTRKELTFIAIVLAVLVTTLIFLNFYRSSIVRYQAGQLVSIQSNESQDSKDSALNSFKLTSKKVLNYQISFDGKGVVFALDDGSVDFISYDGKNRNNLKKPSHQASKALISNDGRSLIQWFLNSSGLQYVDLISREAQILNSNIGNIAFSPDSKKIVYNFFDFSKDEGNISISMADGSGFRNIFKTRIKNMEIFWPENNLISFYPETTSVTDLFFLDKNGLNLKKVLSGIQGKPNIFWSKDGQKFLVFYFSTSGGKLELFSSEGNLIKEFKNTPAFKACSWSIDGKKLICADKNKLIKLDTEKEGFDTFLTLPFDVINLIQSPLENFIIVQGQDRSLYSIKVER